VAGVDLVANGIKSFDVFADVRAANTPVLASGQTLSIQVQGAASINDGLGGDFYWNATSVLADNNATVIRPTSASGAGRWLRLGTPPFGAYGTIAAGTTTDLGTVGPNLVQITGTGPITSFGSSATTARAFYVVTFTGACTLTYNAVSMLTPGAQNVVTGVGDTALLQYLGSGNWNVIALLRAFASPPGEMMLVTTADQPLTSSLTFNNIVGLGVTPLPIGSYQVSLRLMLQGTGGTAQGYKIQLTAAGTVTGLSLGTGVASSNGTPTAQLVAINAPLVQAAISSTTGDMVSLDFILVVSTAGALNAQFTQNASSANATTVKAGSLMAIKRIA
jgi:hypothetical protein